MNSVSAVAGVNPGYDSAYFAVTDPQDAARLVEDEIKALTLPARVFPGRVLYPQDRGCPVGGEAVGAVFATATRTAGPDLLSSFNTVRMNLKQTNLSVITTPDSGIVMTGFAVAFGQDNLLRIARAWQKIATEQYRQAGFYVSGAVFEADGQIFGQAEANPTRITNLSAWQKNAQTLIQTIKPRARPTFRPVGYHYLRD